MALMAETASDREQNYRHQVAAYLKALELTRGWSQSEIGRRAGVASTTINKALKLKHSLGYPKLMILEEQSGIPIHEGLKDALRALHAPRPSPTTLEVEAFLQSSPEWQRMLELGRQLAEATDPMRKSELKRELDQMLAKVA
jgi:transcriptional regulator with XRE-family HTH domain